MKLSPYYSGYDYISTFVDDLIVASKELLQCLEMLARKINLRNQRQSMGVIVSPMAS